MNKADDAMAILKLYELRREPAMRAARQWYLSDFNPTSAMDIVGLFRGGERASANFRMVTSYWDTAASLVLNGGIDGQLFMGANTEHIIVFARITDFIVEVREIFHEPDYLMHLETLVRSLPDFDSKMNSRKQLLAVWSERASSK